MEVVIGVILARDEAAARTYLARQPHLVATGTRRSRRQGESTKRRTKKKRAAASKATGARQPAKAGREVLLA